MLTFETYEDAAGESRWRLRHENGNVMADSSEGYKNPADRDQSIVTICTQLGANNYTVKEVSE